MLVGRSDAEADHHDADKRRIREFSARANEIGSGAELDFVDPCGECSALDQRAIGASIGIGENARDAHARVADAVNGYFDARAGPAQRRVEYVCRETAHAGIAAWK